MRIPIYKNLVAIATFLVAISRLDAARAADKEVPPYIPVQGYLTELSSGEPLNDSSVNIRFSLWDDEAAGAGHEIWSEEYRDTSAVSVVDGFFIVYLGMNTSLDYEKLMYYSGDIPGIDPLLFGEPIDGLWLEIQIDSDTPMERVQLASVPFALEAQYCHQIGEIVEGDVQSKLAFDCGETMFLRGFADGGPICELDLYSDSGDAGISVGVLEVSVGGGLELGGTLAHPEISANFGTASGTVAEGDHGHDHGALPGLADDDHSQYFHLEQDETINGDPTFNGIPEFNNASTPFSVATSSLVTDLNCDMLDGLHGADLVENDCSDCLNETEIEDIYVLSSGDDMTGPLTVSADAKTETGVLGQGVIGVEASGTHYGLFASASDDILATYGVYAETSAPEGMGVYGEVTDTGNSTSYGVFGKTSTGGGYGVVGYATHADGTTRGVFGNSASSAGYGVYGIGQTGVYGGGRSGGYGLYGTSTSDGYGVYGDVSGVGWGLYTPDNAYVGNDMTIGGSISGDLHVTGAIRSNQDSRISLHASSMVLDEYSAGIASIRPGGTGKTYVRASSTGSVTAYLPAHIPATIMGTPQTIKSLEVCYRQEDSSNYIDSVLVGITLPPSSGTTIIGDSTDYGSTTAECFTAEAIVEYAINGAVVVDFYLEFVAAGSTAEMHFNSVMLTIGPYSGE